MACARRGDLATYPDQATVLTTKEFSLHRGHFRRGESLGRSGKTQCKSSARRVRREAQTLPQGSSICLLF